MVTNSTFGPEVEPTDLISFRCRPIAFPFAGKRWQAHVQRWLFTRMYCDAWRTETLRSGATGRGKVAADHWPDHRGQAAQVAHDSALIGE